MNRDRVRCYKCKEYDHFANGCPNSVMDDSDGYESDRAALELIAMDAEIYHIMKEQDCLKNKTIRTYKR